MKKTIAVILALFMIVTMLPMTVIFASADSDNTGDLTLLLDIPNLGTTVETGDVTLTASGLGGVKTTVIDGATITSGVAVDSGNAWFGSVAQTNLPLTEDSHYVFTYTAQYFEPLSLMGFSFLRFNNPEKGAAIRDQALTVYFDQRPTGSFGYIYLESNWANYDANTGLKYENVGVENAQLYEENEYVIEIDGTKITVYMNQKRLGTMSCEKWMKYSPVLAMGTCLLSSTGATQDAQIAAIKDIKLYSGSYWLYDNLETLNTVLDVPTLETTVETGDVTLTMSNLGGVQPATFDGADLVSGVSADSGDKWFGYVSETNLPLTEDSHYVISYTAKYYEPISLMGFSFLRFNNPGKNANIRDQALTAYFDQRPGNNGNNYIYLQSNWANFGAGCVRYDDAGITADQLYQENEYVIAINGWKVSLFMNHNFLGEMSCEGWKDWSPYIAMGTCMVSRSGATSGNPVATIKDIKLYEGTYELYKTVTFERDGDVLGTRICTVGQPIGELPVVSVQDDEDAVWYVKDTDNEVNDTLIVRRDITLEVKAVKKGEPQDPNALYNYYMDFTALTPDAGLDGTINDTLPEGWVAKRDSDIATIWKDDQNKFTNITTAINYVTKDGEGDVQSNNGVRLGGDGQGIAMTKDANVPSKILNATTDYTITVKWNTSYKFARIRFGWSGTNEFGGIKVPTATNIAPATNVSYNYTGGPHNLGGPEEAFGDGVDKNGGNVTFAEKLSAQILDEYNRELGYEALYDLHKEGVKYGHQVTTTLAVTDGKLVAVYMTIDGITVKYLPASDYIPIGYFSVWITNWGDSNAASIQSVEIREGTYTPSKFPVVSNVTPISAVDFVNVKNDGQLNAAGYSFYAEKPADSGDYEPAVTYTGKGLALNAANGEFLVNNVEITNKGNYLIDYTFRKTSDQVAFYTALGLGGDPVTLETLKSQWNNTSVNSAYLFGAAGYKFYTDETFETELSEAPVVPIELNAPIRVRIIVSNGSSDCVFLTVGNEHFCLKRENRITSASGLVGFTFGDEYNAGRGIVLEKCVISTFDAGDTTGGDLIVPDREVDYADVTETYYKDGYVLHHMDFSKISDYYDTSYSFASNSSSDRVVKVEDGVLFFSNTGAKSAFLMFTGNAIPKNITEYTANFKFRFVGEENSYFGFIRGISLNEDGTKKSSQSVEISFKGEKVYDAQPVDEAVWNEIVAAMKAGEWLEVTVSNVGRYVDTVVIKCGEKSVSFNMEKNRQAEGGYMGFTIGANANVEIESVTILAGIAANATTPIWPEGVAAGDLVQNVTADAVSTGTKPTYADLIPIEEEETTTPESVEETPEVTEPTTPETKDNTGKKGCKSSMVVLPALLVTAVCGCAVTVCKKKKED